MKKTSRAEDFMKISGGILSALEGAKDYSKEKLKLRLGSLLDSLDFAKKEDFDILSEMCKKLKSENQALSKKIKQLERKIDKSLK